MSNNIIDIYNNNTTISNINFENPKKILQELNEKISRIANHRFIIQVLKSIQVKENENLFDCFYKRFIKNFDIKELNENNVLHFFSIYFGEQIIADILSNNNANRIDDDHDLNQVSNGEDEDKDRVTKQNNIEYLIKNKGQLIDLTKLLIEYKVKKDEINKIQNLLINEAFKPYIKNNEQNNEKINQFNSSFNEYQKKTIDYFNELKSQLLSIKLSENQSNLALEKYNKENSQAIASVNVNNSECLIPTSSIKYIKENIANLDPQDPMKILKFIADSNISINDVEIKSYLNSFLPENRTNLQSFINESAGAYYDFTIKKCWTINANKSDQKLSPITIILEFEKDIFATSELLEFLREILPVQYKNTFLFFEPVFSLYELTRQYKISSFKIFWHKNVNLLQEDIDAYSKANEFLLTYLGYSADQDLKKRFERYFESVIQIIDRLSPDSKIAPNFSDENLVDLSNFLNFLFRDCINFRRVFKAFLNIENNESIREEFGLNACTKNNFTPTNVIGIEIDFSEPFKDINLTAKRSQSDPNNTDPNNKNYNKAIEDSEKESRIQEGNNINNNDLYYSIEEGANNTTNQEPQSSILNCNITTLYFSFAQNNTN